MQLLPYHLASKYEHANFTVFFFLLVPGAPNLHENLLLRIEDGSRNVPIDLRRDPVAFPEPSYFTWNKDGQPLTGLVLTYSSVTFATVWRTDAGNYTVSATNFVLGDSTKQVGNDTGSFFLDVICRLCECASCVMYLHGVFILCSDGPSFQSRGPVQRYVLLNDSLSLVCGTGLDSNPQATITWTAPDGTTIKDNAQYDLENGPDIVRLNFTHTIISDTGTWRCDVIVTSERHAVSSGRLVLVDPEVIGAPIQHDIRLTVIGKHSIVYSNVL